MYLAPRKPQVSDQEPQMLRQSVTILLRVREIRNFNIRPETAFSDRPVVVFHSLCTKITQ